MSSAAFSMPSDPSRKISVRHRTKLPVTASSSAADDAIQQVLRRRSRRREDRESGRSRPEGSGGVTAVVADSMARLGIGPWLIRVVLVGGVAAVLGAGVWAIATSGTPRHTIGGVLLVNGKPLANAALVFHRRDERHPLRREFRTGADGRFQAEPPGLPAGVYAVVVTEPAKAGRKPAKPVVPKAYLDPATTPLRVDVCEALPDLRLLVRK